MARKTKDSKRTAFSLQPFDMSWFDRRGISCDIAGEHNHMSAIERDGLMIFSTANPGVRESLIRSYATRISVSIYINADLQMELPPSEWFPVIGRHSIPINSWKGGDMEYFVDGTGLWSDAPFVACSMRLEAFKLLVWDHTHATGRPRVTYPKVSYNPRVLRDYNYDPTQDLLKWIERTQRFRGGHAYYEGDVDNY